MQLATSPTIHPAPDKTKAAAAADRCRRMQELQPKQQQRQHCHHHHHHHHHHHNRQPHQQQLPQKHLALLPLLVLVLLLATPAAAAGQTRTISTQQPSAPAQIFADGWRECSAQANHPGEYGAEAVGNLTAFKSKLLSLVWASFDPDIPFGVDKSRFDVLQPIAACPPHRPLTGYGGHAQLCRLAHLRAPCLIYDVSAGAGDAGFATAVLQSTKCELHTFACKPQSSQGGSDSSSHERHTVHPVCIAGQGSDAGMPVASWKQLQQRLGHTQRVADVVRVDLDGKEPGLLSELQAPQLLPRQLLIHLHLRPRNVNASSSLAQPAARTPAQLALLALHLANLGYAAVARQDDPPASGRDRGCCASYTFLHVERQWDYGAKGVLARRGRLDVHPQLPDKPSRLSIWAKLLSPLSSAERGQGGQQQAQQQAQQQQQQQQAADQPVRLGVWARLLAPLRIEGGGGPSDRQRRA